jgi:hypothetical protein
MPFWAAYGKSLKNLEHMEMRAQYKILFWPLPLFNKRPWSF